VDRLARAIAAIDAANADDPERIVVDGVERSKELAHAEMMTTWVRRLDPDATDLQLIAARAHHLRRWTVPRADYPDGRAGYLRWRTALRRQHADQVAAILGEVGYDPSDIQRVQAIIGKEGLRARTDRGPVRSTAVPPEAPDDPFSKVGHHGPDPQVQTHEDALCLVFLATQFDALSDKLGDDHIVEVVRKTLTKMSDRGIGEAVRLPLSERGRSIVERASSPA
jgi:hypothetical protein